MSTNHNRIKVADLETNQPNKILKTNVKGELEFSDANLQSETYNALDYTIEGKALDARQGKVLKDMIDNIPPQLIEDVSATQAGIVNNVTSQELGGADKTINGVRIGRGAGNDESNTVIGILSLYSNTTGIINTAVGNRSLGKNTEGCSNTAIGTNSLSNNKTGSSNTSVGTQSLFNNITGSLNTGIGVNSMSRNSTGNMNTAVGHQSLCNNSIGNQNTSIGGSSLNNNTTGNYNTVIGSYSLNTNISGNCNIAIGRLAGNGVTTGSNNTIIGYSTSPNSDDSNLVILSDGGNNVALKKEADNRLLAPTLTNALINSGGPKSLITKEYLDANNTQTENYNALDCTTEGKALDARQGKVLKDLIDNKTVNLASDTETQITNSVTEDNKVVSRSKLFNWWNWVTAQTQIIKAVWNFSKGLKVNDSTSNYTTEMLQNMFVAKLDQLNNGVCKAEYGFETVKWSTVDGYSTLLKPITPNQNRTLTLPNKSGTIAIANDFVKTAAGTITTPSLIIPNGSLTTTPQNGAIERDQNGVLWETRNGLRYKLLNTLDASSFVAKENLPIDIINDTPTKIIPTKSSLDLLYPDVPVGTYIHYTQLQDNPIFPVTYRKTTFGWIMFGMTKIIQ